MFWYYLNSVKKQILAEFWGFIRLKPVLGLSPSDKDYKEVERMKRSVVLAGTAALFFVLILSNCSTSRVLTPGAIEIDIDGLDNLANCQYFLSKEITLVSASSKRQTGVNSGIVKAQRIINNRTITIDTIVPGILQTKNNAGDSLKGYNLVTNEGVELITLYILFETDNDNLIKFSAIYNDKMHRFELFDNEIVFDGVTYSVTYYGNDRPYLHYKYLESTLEQSETRKAKGRRVGS